MAERGLAGWHRPKPLPGKPGVLRTDVGGGVEWWGPDGIGKEDGGLRGRAGGG